MEGQEDQQTKARVVKVDSLESWDLFVNQATNQGCPIVIHFTASWCMPSVAMNPFFEELASTYPDVLFLTVDVDEVKKTLAVEPPTELNKLRLVGIYDLLFST
uniref:Thioredoxin domain-containing protein n=1 Tax=Fagus sylvatica TaxID=28930 RepID=A0A2N9FP98_FAGSY